MISNAAQRRGRQIWTEHQYGRGVEATSCYWFRWTLGDGGEADLGTTTKHLRKRFKFIAHSE
jgi:hypothetical protein